MYWRKLKTGGYEQARNANFKQNQDVSSGTPSLATNTLMATAGLISQTFL
jgi:hypothetical protein